MVAVKCRFQDTVNKGQSVWQVLLGHTAVRTLEAQEFL